MWDSARQWAQIALNLHKFYGRSNCDRLDLTGDKAKSIRAPLLRDDTAKHVHGALLNTSKVIHRTAIHTSSIAFKSLHEKTVLRSSIASVFIRGMFCLYLRKQSNDSRGIQCTILDGETCFTKFLIHLCACLIPAT